jgi:hypothetical protein
MYAPVTRLPRRSSTHGSAFCVDRRGQRIHHDIEANDRNPCPDPTATLEYPEDAQNDPDRGCTGKRGVLIRAYACPAPFHIKKLCLNDCARITSTAASGTNNNRNNNAKPPTDRGDSSTICQNTWIVWAGQSRLSIRPSTPSRLMPGRNCLKFWLPHPRSTVRRLGGHPCLQPDVEMSENVQ